MLWQQAEGRAGLQVTTEGINESLLPWDHEARLPRPPGERASLSEPAIELEMARPLIYSLEVRRLGLSIDKLFCFFQYLFLHFFNLAGRRGFRYM